MKHLTLEYVWPLVPNRFTLFPSKKAVELNNEKYHHPTPIIVTFAHIKGNYLVAPEGENRPENNMSGSF